MLFFSSSSHAKNILLTQLPTFLWHSNSLVRTAWPFYPCRHAHGSLSPLLQQISSTCLLFVLLWGGSIVCHALFIASCGANGRRQTSTWCCEIVEGLGIFLATEIIFKLNVHSFSFSQHVHKNCTTWNFPAIALLPAQHGYEFHHYGARLPDHYCQHVICLVYLVPLPPTLQHLPSLCTLPPQREQYHVWDAS